MSRLMVASCVAVVTLAAAGIACYFLILQKKKNGSSGDRKTEEDEATSDDRTGLEERDSAVERPKLGDAPPEQSPAVSGPTGHSDRPAASSVCVVHESSPDGMINDTAEEHDDLLNAPDAADERRKSSLMSRSMVIVDDERRKSSLMSKSMVIIDSDGNENAVDEQEAASKDDDEGGNSFLTDSLVLVDAAEKAAAFETEGDRVVEAHESSGLEAGGSETSQRNEPIGCEEGAKAIYDPELDRDDEEEVVFQPEVEREESNGVDDGEQQENGGSDPNSTKAVDEQEAASKDDNEGGSSFLTDSLVLVDAAEKAAAFETEGDRVAEARESSGLEAGVSESAPRNEPTGCEEGAKAIDDPELDRDDGEKAVLQPAVECDESNGVEQLQENGDSDPNGAKRHSSSGAAEDEEEEAALPVQDKKSRKRNKKKNKKRPNLNGNDEIAASLV